MRQSGILISFFLLTACLSTACVVVQEHRIQLDSKTGKQAFWEARRLSLENIQTWSLQGRVAGKSDGEGFRVGVRWQQRQQKFDISLHGLLGRKVAVISGDEGSVQATTSRGASYSAQDPEDLLQNLFGYFLPVKSLHYWVRGIPDPGQVYMSLQLDDQGRLQRLDQAGWLIDYNRYHDDEPALPAFIKISNTDIDANIIISHWALNVMNP